MNDYENIPATEEETAMFVEDIQYQEIDNRYADEMLTCLLEMVYPLKASQDC
jgi:hypothetical protein